MSEQTEASSAQSPTYAVGLEPVYLRSCPYLGLLEDRRTSLAYPDQNNYCHRLQSATAVDLTHQRTYCLAGEHTDCYVFQQTAPPPAEEALDRDTWLEGVRQRAHLSVAALFSRFDWPANALSEGFRLPYEFFSGQLHLPPDPWGRESFAIPENPFKQEFAMVPVLLHRGYAATRGAIDRLPPDPWGLESFAVPENPFQREFALAPVLLRQGYEATRQALKQLPPDPWGLESFAVPENPFKQELAMVPVLLRQGYEATQHTLKKRVALPETRIDQWLHLPDGWSQRPLAYLVFPLMLLLMFVASLAWWPAPDHAAAQVTALGPVLAEAAQEPAGLAREGAPGRSWRRSSQARVLEPGATPVVSLNSTNGQLLNSVNIFAGTVTIGDSVDTSDRGSELFALEIRPTEESSAPPTAQPFVLGPQVLPTAVPTVAATAMPAILPTAEPLPTTAPPATPTSLPTAVPTVAPAVAPTAVPTLAPTEPPPQEPTAVPPLPIVDVAYVHTGALNLRSGPGLGYPSVDIAYNRTPVYLLPSQGYEPWVLIRLDSGSEGWVNRNYLIFEN